MLDRACVIRGRIGGLGQVGRPRCDANAGIEGNGDPPTERNGSNAPYNAALELLLSRLGKLNVAHQHLRYRHNEHGRPLHRVGGRGHATSLRVLRAAPDHPPVNQLLSRWAEKHDKTDTRALVSGAHEDLPARSSAVRRALLPPRG
jgi:hypothetical protein